MTRFRDSIHVFHITEIIGPYVLFVLVFLQISQIQQIIRELTDILDKVYRLESEVLSYKSSSLIDSHTAWTFKEFKTDL